jgi:hypothetical protein
MKTAFLTKISAVSHHYGAELTKAGLKKKVIFEIFFDRFGWILGRQRRLQPSLPRSQPSWR